MLKKVNYRFFLFDEKSGKTFTSAHCIIAAAGGEFGWTEMKGDLVLAHFPLLALLEILLVSVVPVICLFIQLWGRWLLILFVPALKYSIPETKM